MIFAQCISDFSGSYGLPLGLFIAGLVGGVTHCAGMCAPFVLAQSANEPLSLRRMGRGLLLPYHLGRMTTYILLAVIVGNIVRISFLFSPAKAIITAPLLMVAGTVFLVTAFPKLSVVFPWVTRLSMSKPFTFITQMSGSLLRRSDVVSRFGLGMILGLMPCGLVVSAVLAAGSAGTALGAGLSMGAFALGTMPALMCVGLLGQRVAGANPRLRTILSQGGMVMSALWLFVTAGIMIF